MARASSLVSTIVGPLAQFLKSSGQRPHHGKSRAKTLAP